MCGVSSARGFLKIDKKGKGISSIHILILSTLSKHSSPSSDLHKAIVRNLPVTVTVPVGSTQTQMYSYISCLIFNNQLKTILWAE